MASYIDELKAQINKTKETKAEEFKKSEKKELDLSAPQSFKNTNNSISENKSSDDFLELDSLKDAFTKTNQSQKPKPIVETTKIEEPIVSKENEEFEESVKETINKSISASKIN